MTFTVALPTADRGTTYAFYTGWLALTPVGELADDGLPEPLQFEVEGARLMFIPPGGFGWVTGDHETAGGGTSECLLSLSLDSPREVDALVERARAAGARIVEEPQQQGWGYVALVADPDDHLWQLLSD